jgi:myosin heavy subunit
MSDDVKKFAELEAKADKLTETLAEVTKALDIEKSAREDAETKLAEVEKAAADAAEETLDVAGATIKKSAVGDEAFAILKKQQDETNKANEALAVAKATEAVEKSMGNLPGEVSDKAAAYRYIEKADEAVSKTLAAMLAAGNKALEEAMVEKGHDGEGAPEKAATKAEGKLQKAASDIAKRDSVDAMTAFNSAMIENPALYEEFLAERAA